VQYISRFCSLHKKGGGGLSENGSIVSETTWDELTKKEDRKKWRDGVANDVMIEISRIKHVTFLHSVGKSLGVCKIQPTIRHNVTTK
jgi:hypothetical protein